ncbi:MAG: hypothetical protein H0W90_13945 [Actinobacteria bacterium]|nr:hypothetical protein [Actinomycetota bacterium]
MKLESASAIRDACDRLLKAAGVEGTLPTPVSDIVAAAELNWGSDDLFADETLERAPEELRKKMRTLRGKLCALLDRRERKVYVNPEIQLVGRRNFHTLHEVGHDLLEWQRDLYFPDDDYTLSPRTKVGQEREANFAGAEMLFQGDFFTHIARDFRIGMAEIEDLSRMIGASTHAGFRRYAASHTAPVAGVVLDRSPTSINPLRFKRREAMSSPVWETRFASLATWPKYLDVVAHPFLAEIVRLDIEPPPVTFTTCLADRDGEPIELNGELVSNSYNLFVLFWVPQREWLKRRRTFATARS